jgi:hypothetical protein
MNDPEVTMLDTLDHNGLIAHSTALEAAAPVAATVPATIPNGHWVRGRRAALKPQASVGWAGVDLSNSFRGQRNAGGSKLPKRGSITAAAFRCSGRASTSES